MNKPLTHKLLAALLCAGLLAAGGTAQARGGDDWDDRGRGWKSHKHDHKYRQHYRDHSHSRTIIRERVVVREAPRRYREVREYYYPEPYPAYVYGRSPAITIGVNIPPLVIPLR